MLYEKVDYARRERTESRFFLCPEKKFMFLSVAKNACTTLKSLLFKISLGRNYEAADGFGIHYFWGYKERTGRIIQRDNAPALRAYIDFARFAVYRDPVERFLSTYHNKVLYPPGPDHFFDRHGILNLSLDAFIEVTEEVLKVDDPLQIDEHLRPQHQCYDASDVNHIVPLRDLGRYLLVEYGISEISRENWVRGPRTIPTPHQIDKIKQLYARDYEIVPIAI